MPVPSMTTTQPNCFVNVHIIISELYASLVALALGLDLCHVTECITAISQANIITCHMPCATYPKWNTHSSSGHNSEDMVEFYLYPPFYAHLESSDGLLQFITYSFY